MNDLVRVDLGNGEAAMVDQDVADQVWAGYSVGEAEDIVDHDEGMHDSESVPGCPRCEDLYDEDW